jgi:hypothetical protein
MALAIKLLEVSGWRLDQYGYSNPCWGPFPEDEKQSFSPTIREFLDDSLAYIYSGLEKIYAKNPRLRKKFLEEHPKILEQFPNFLSNYPGLKRGYLVRLKNMKQK